MLQRRKQTSALGKRQQQHARDGWHCLRRLERRSTLVGRTLYTIAAAAAERAFDAAALAVNVGTAQAETAAAVAARCFDISQIFAASTHAMRERKARRLQASVALHPIFKSGASKRR